MTYKNYTTAYAMQYHMLVEELKSDSAKAKREMEAYDKLKVAVCQPENVFTHPKTNQYFYDPQKDQLYRYEADQVPYGRGWHLMAPDMRKYRPILQYYYELHRQTMGRYAKEVLDGL